jgi:hypothetical protein
MASRKLLLVAGALSALGGCAPYRVDFAAGSRAPHAVVHRPADAVVVLAIPPANRYVEIGRIELTKTGMFPRHEKVVAEMRREAGARGCDALVLATPEQGGLRYTGACIVHMEGGIPSTR